MHPLIRLLQENKKLTKSLEEAQKIVDKVVDRGTDSLLEQWEIGHSDLVFGKTIGEGAFGTVRPALPSSP